MNDKVVFALTDDKSICILGIPEAAWEDMKKGLTKTFDLTSIGFPVKIVLYSGKDHNDCMSKLNIDKDTLDLRGLDMGFGK